MAEIRAKKSHKRALIAFSVIYLCLWVYVEPYPGLAHTTVRLYMVAMIVMMAVGKKTPVRHRKKLLAIYIPAALLVHTKGALDFPHMSWWAIVISCLLMVVTVLEIAGSAYATYNHDGLFPERGFVSHRREG